jgi:hypothetical protein
VLANVETVNATLAPIGAETETEHERDPSAAVVHPGAVAANGTTVVDPFTGANVNEFVALET